MAQSQDFDMPPFVSFLAWQGSRRIPVTALMDEAELVDVQIHSESFPLADDPSEKQPSMNNPFQLRLPAYTPPFLLVMNTLHPSWLRRSHLRVSPGLILSPSSFSLLTMFL